MDTEWAYLNESAEQAVIGTNFVQAARLIWLPSEVSDWLILTSYELSSDNPSSSIETRVTLDDTIAIGEVSREQAGDAEYWAVSHLKVLQNLSNPDVQHTITVDWRSLGASATARIRNIRIQALRIDDELGREYFYQEQENNSTTTTTYVDKVALNIVPTTSGRYVLLGNVELDASGTALNKFALARIRANNQTIPIAIGGTAPRADKHFSAEDKDITDHMVFNYFGVVNLSPTLNNLSIQVAHEGNESYTASRARLLALRLDDVYEFASIANESEINTTSSSSLVNASILEFTPSETRTYLIMQAIGHTAETVGNSSEIVFAHDDQRLSNATVTVESADDYFVSTNYFAKNLSAALQRIANRFRKVDQATAFAKVSHILAFSPPRANKLVITHFNISSAEGGRRAFVIELLNNISSPIPNIGWQLSFQGIRINETRLETLLPNATMHVFVDYNFTSQGNILARARVSNGSIGDRRLLLFAIGDELDVRNLRNVTAGLRQVFRFVVASIWNTDIVADWSIDTDGLIVKSSTPQVLYPGKNYTIFVERNYTTGGTFDIEATANTSRSSDMQTMSVTI